MPILGTGSYLLYRAGLLSTIVIFMCTVGTHSQANLHCDDAVFQESYVGLILI